MPVASLFPELRPANLHRRAEACRSLATTSNTADRKALWLDRAAYWEELAFEASARLVEALRPSASNKAASALERLSIDSGSMRSAVEREPPGVRR
jgi:hypothetical protein